MKLEQGETCPACGEMLPPLEYCPECGVSWKHTDKTIEKLLASMKAETERGIHNAKARDGRAAWYWTYIGALDMAQQIGAIDDTRRQQLYKEAESLKEAIGKEEKK